MSVSSSQLQTQRVLRRRSLHIKKSVVGLLRSLTPLVRSRSNVASLRQCQGSRPVRATPWATRPRKKGLTLSPRIKFSQKICPGSTDKGSSGLLELLLYLSSNLASARSFPTKSLTGGDVINHLSLKSSSFIRPVLHDILPLLFKAWRGQWYLFFVPQAIPMCNVA